VETYRHAAAVGRHDDGDQLLARVLVTHDASPRSPHAPVPMRFAESRPRCRGCPPPPNVRLDADRWSSGPARVVAGPWTHGRAGLLVAHTE
jgi:hypothetical protein